MKVALFIILFLILVMLVFMTYYLRTLKNKADREDNEPVADSVIQTQNYIYAALVITSLLTIFSFYLLLQGSPWEGHLMEWLNIIVRLMHITFGIAWIGASFYFIFLENALNRTNGVREELAGNLWAVHGGGFYYLEKYKVAPKQLPKHLHWFKYEAYFTWVSGFCLLFIVYYFNASAMLIDKNVLDISTLAAISIGIASFAVAWIIYDVMCKSPLRNYKVWFTITGFLICILFAYFYTKVFSARAAYIHFGAMLGSIMVANVFFVIIPSQKALVKSAKEGTQLNAQLGRNAGMRSLHNNYFTLPVLFVMVSNHFPSTFGNENPWFILSIITLGTAGVKHYLNIKEKGQLSYWVLPLSILVILAAAFLTAPPRPGTCNSAVNFTEVNAIIQRRCIQCHSATPTDDVFTAPPNGVVYDTPEIIVKLKDKIMQRVVITKTMPQNNKTNITEAERNTIRCWIEQGAKIN